MKIVILDGYTANPGDLSWEELGQLGELTVCDRTPHLQEEIIRRIGDSEAVLTNKTPITRQTLEACPKLRYIGVLATGYNVVDLQAAAERGVAVSNIPSYSTDEVAQFTLALLLEICCRVGHHDQAVHAGRWERSPDFCFWDYPLLSLSGKTMGLIGFGRIGQATAKLARAFGMRVLTCTRTRREELSKLAEHVSFERLLAGSDVISLHCPLSDETKGIINRESISRMKDGVILLNTGRGPLIVEQDLADALNAGKVFAAGVDVVSAEPIRPDNPLLKAKNCVITPHIAWASGESRARLVRIAADNLRQFLAGTPVNIVNR